MLTNLIDTSLLLMVGLGLVSGLDLGFSVVVEVSPAEARTTFI